MEWQQWLYLILAVGALMITATRIGKPREPVSPGEFACQIAISALMIWLVLSI
jgi:hypothetical protein